MVKKTAVERFQIKIDQKGSDDCWVWLGSKTPTGYGQFYPTPQKPIGAHRYAYILAVGDIPRGFQIDHLCKNPSCVNPNHLEAVTHRNNVRRANGLSDIYMNGDENVKVAGRPKLAPTELITIRLPITTLEIIQRRSAKAHMPPSVYLAERVIHHEVVWKHYLTKAEKER